MVPKVCFRLSEVLKLFPVSKSTWWAGVKSGRYPQPVKLSERVTAWKKSDIDRLIAKTGGQLELDLEPGGDNE